MKKAFLKYYFLVLAFILVSHNVNGQSDCLISEYPQLFDSLHFYQDYEKSLDKYTSHFKTLRKRIVASDSLHWYEEISPYLEWMVDHPQADSVFLRKQYCYYGYVLKETNQTEQAISFYTKAHKYGGNFENVDDFFFIENILGTIYNKKGDHEKSKYYYNKSINGLESLVNKTNKNHHKRSKYLNQKIRIKNNLAYLLYWNKEIKLAKVILYENIIEAKENSSAKALTFCYHYLGEIYVGAVELDSVRKYTTLIKQNLEKTKKKRDKTNAEIILLGLKAKLAYLDKKPLETIKYYQESIKLEVSERDVAKTYYEIANTYLSIDDIEEAHKIILKGFDALSINYSEVLNGQLYEENTIADLLTIAGKTYEKKYINLGNIKYIDTAINCYLKGIEVYEILRLNYLLKGSKLISIKENKDLVNKAIQLLYLKQDKVGPSINLTTNIISLFKKSKQLILSETNQERLQIDQLSAKRRETLRYHQDKIMNIVSQNNKITTFQQDKIIEHRIEIKRILNKTTVSNHNDEKTDKPYIEFLIGESYVYSIDNFSKNKSFKRLISKKELINSIELSRTSIAKKDTSLVFYQNQYFLFKSLFDQSIDLPKKLTIIPDGELSLLAFSALITDLKTKIFLVEDVVINTKLTTRISSQNYELMDLLTAIAPKYQVNKTSQTKSTINLLPLHFTSKEIEAIHKNYTANINTTDQITKADFIKSLKQSSIIHFAGHNISHNGTNFLALSSDSTQWIEDKEIIASKNNTDLVVLSACNTGVGNLEYGEGINSIAKSFLTSGSKSIIYTLWAINDHTTSQLMSGFYKNLEQGTSISTSFVENQRSFLATTTQKLRHPYYWSAFVCIDNTTFIKKSTNQRLLYIIIISLIIVTILLLIKTKKHEKHEKLH